LEYEDTLPELDEATDRLSNQVAIYSYARGDYAAAARLLDRAARICERHRGLDDPETATRLNNLAVIRRANDQHDAALTAIKKALDIRERLFGRSHVLYAISLNVKGSIL
jgi:tetratricopeptide (TPR) repeat protein